MASIIRREVLFEELQAIIPTLKSSLHKGQNGKVGVIGGSFEYTGAPFYGASSALRGGGDLSHIFCTEKAATPIKSYSPEVIVHPYLISEVELKREATKEEVEECVKSITKWYEPLHSVVIGSGLGRDDGVSKCIEDLYSNMKELITVCDGDFFWFLSEKNKENLAEKIRKRSKYTVLTPNKVELKRLWDFLKGDEKKTPEDAIKKDLEQISAASGHVFEVSTSSELVKDHVEVSQRLNNVTLLVKGEVDIITNGKEAYVVKKASDTKRCGGQGDILGGLTGLYSFWDLQKQKEKDEDLKEFSLVKGCMLASYITRLATQKAFDKYKYGLTAPNILEEVPNAINSFADKGFNK